MRENNRLNWIPVIIFLLLILSFAAANLLIPDKDYSPSEKRMLTKKPKLTKSNLLKGKFQKKYEKYLADQFVFRDRWITVKSYADRSLGKVESNGVYFGKDGYLFDKYTASDFDGKLVQKNQSYLKSFLEDYIKKLGADHVKTLFVPTKSHILRGKLPPFSEHFSEESFLERLENELPKGSFLSAEPILKEHYKEPVYYRTDHHWTTLGAYYGYRMWAESMNLKPTPVSDFHIEKAADHFLGSTYSKINMPVKPDPIYLYHKKNRISYHLIYNLGEKETKTLYDYSMLKGSDKYSVFLGGNQGVIEINTNLKNNKTLFVIKDSFANCFLPFAINHFQKTVVVDLRHINVAIRRIIKLYKPSDLLILYNSAQFMKEKSIRKLRK